MRPQRLLSQAAAGGGIVAKQVATADVRRTCLSRLVVGLFHDGALGGAAFRRRGGETGSERVAGERPLGRDPPVVPES